jgi:hypothetical protein
MIHGFMGLQYITHVNLKYFQINIERWLFNFKDKKQRDSYVWVTEPPKDKSKKKTGKSGKAPKEIKQTTKNPPKQAKPSKEANPPKQANPPKTNKPVNKSKK